MRTMRLLTVMMDLTRASSTVAELAARHGVSERTIQRDVAALHEMGVPVWTRTGPGGGVGLVNGWRSPLAGMTGAELQALVIGEAASRGLGLQEDFVTARLKMLSASSAQSRAVDAAHERVLIDNERWFAEPGHPAALPAVARAVWSGRRVAASYLRPGQAGPAQRLLDPLGLVLKTDVWYLVAAHRRRVRTYRLSRLTDARVLDDVARRPPGFSLREYWEQASRDFEASIYTLPVRLRIPSGSVAMLRSAVPGPHTVAALGACRPVAGDRIDVELLMESTEIATAQLLAVPGVEVRGPAELRAELHRRGLELTAQNLPGPHRGE